MGRARPRHAPPPPHRLACQCRQACGGTEGSSCCGGRPPPVVAAARGDWSPAPAAALSPPGGAAAAGGGGQEGLRPLVEAPASAARRRKQGGIWPQGRGQRPAGAAGSWPGTKAPHHNHQQKTPQKSVDMIWAQHVVGRASKSCCGPSSTTTRKKRLRRVLQSQCALPGGGRWRGPPLGGKSGRWGGAAAVVGAGEAGKCKQGSPLSNKHRFPSQETSQGRGH